MRDFKLRAWHKKQKRMFSIYGIGKDFITEDTLDGVDPGNNYFSGDYLKDIEVMQYTGLKDKKNREIYEGDLLKGNDSCIYKVYWSDKLCAFSSIGNEGDYMGPYTHTLATNTGYLKERFEKEIEVIGNIHENPELFN